MDPFAFPIKLGSLPAYRDADTRDSFARLGTFFGCVDLCEKEYELKRVLYPLPAVALGERKRMTDEVMSHLFVPALVHRMSITGWQL